MVRLIQLTSYAETRKTITDNEASTTIVKSIIRNIAQCAWVRIVINIVNQYEY